MVVLFIANHELFARCTETLNPPTPPPLARLLSFYRFPSFFRLVLTLFRLVRSLFILFHGAKKEYKAVLWSVGEAVGRAWSAAVYAEPPCLPPAAAGLRVRPCSLGGYVSSVRLGAHRTTMDALSYGE